MTKYIPVLALLLCACASSTPRPVHSILPSVVTLKDPATSVADTLRPVNIELPNQHQAQALRCADELECFQRLTGLCPNGYDFQSTLHAGENKVVGMLFRCTTDERKAEAARQEAVEKAQEERWRAARETRVQAEEAAAQKAQEKTSKPTKK